MQPALRACFQGTSPTWEDEVAADSRFHPSMESTEGILAKLAIRDDAFIQSILAGRDEASLSLSQLDPKTHALARVAALVALDAPTPSYMWAVETAREAGLTDREIVGALVAVLPAVGATRVVAAAPKLGLALGYDVGQRLEDSGVLFG
jgi:4-carboxymuconolactone decarboxylase